MFVTTLPRWMRISRGIAVVLALLVALASYRFLAMPLVLAFANMTPLIEGARVAFLAHISAAPIVLALGVFQLMPGLRQRRPKVHRIMGRIVVAMMVVGGAGALVMAPHANGGMISTIGFGLLAVLWIGCAVIGLVAVRRRDFAAHRRFMIRGYALTFAAVALRVELGVMMASGMTYVDAIRVLSWVSWVPLLIVAEVWLRRRAP